jgi:hypothetical protein
MSFFLNEFAVYVLLIVFLHELTELSHNNSKIQILLFSRVMEGTSSKAIIIPATGDSLGVTPRDGDISWKDFLSRAAGRYAIYLVLPVSHRNK